MAEEHGPRSLVRRPLLWVGCCFCGGVALTHYGYFAATLLIAGAGLLLLLHAAWCARRRPLPEAGLFSEPGWLIRAGALQVLFAVGALLVGVGGWLHRERANEIMDGAQVLAAQMQRRSYADWRMRLLQPPETALAHEEEGFWKAPAEVLLLDGRVPEHRTAVLVYGSSERDLRRGDILQGRILIYAPRPPAWPGAFSYPAYLAGLGLSGRVKLLAKSVTESFADPADAVLAGKERREKQDGAFTLWRPASYGVLSALDDLRAAGIRQTLRLLPGQSGAFVAAALYGYRDDLDQETNECFRYVGIGHILAISGMNVGMVVGLVWSVLALLTHDRRKMAAVCLLVCLAYLIISGGQITAVRAGVIAIIYLGGFFFSRRGDFMNSLGAAALLLIGYNTFTLFSLSFQLSFAAVIAISCLDREYKRILPAWFPETTALKGCEAQKVDKPEEEMQAGFRAWMRQGCTWLVRSAWLLTLMSLTAFAGVWGLMAWAFTQVSFSGLLINIVVIPLMTFSLAGGMLLPLADCLPAGVEAAVAWVLGLPTDAMLAIAKAGMWLPGGGVPVYQPPLWLLLGHYLLAGLFLARGVLPSGRGWRWLRGGAWSMLAASILGLGLYCLGPESKPERSVAILPGSQDCAVLFDGEGGVRVVGELQRSGMDLPGYLRYRRVGHIDRIDILSLNDTIKAEEAQSPAGILSPRVIGQLSVNRILRLNWPMLAPLQAEEKNGRRDVPVSAIKIFPEDGVALWRAKSGTAWMLEAWGGRWFFTGWLWPEQCIAAYWKLTANGAPAVQFLRVRGRKPIPPPGKALCFGRGAVEGGQSGESFGVVEFTPVKNWHWMARGWSGEAWNYWKSWKVE